MLFLELCTLSGADLGIYKQPNTVMAFLHIYTFEITVDESCGNASQF